MQYAVCSAQYAVLSMQSSVFFAFESTWNVESGKKNFRFSTQRSTLLKLIPSKFKFLFSKFYFTSMKVHDLEFELFITEETIQERVKAMARDLNERFANQNPLFLAILNGSYIFAADLTRNFDFPCEILFVRISSYQGLSSSGVVEIEDGNLGSIEGRDVIIIEDIVDSGRTMHQYIPYLKTKNPKSIYLTSLLFKKEALQFDVQVDAFGFEIPPDFVVGYGLDYNGHGRNLEAIYKLKS